MSRASSLPQENLSGGRFRPADQRTARAKTECRIASVDEKRFLFLVQQTPYFALEMMRTISGRLRERLHEKW